MDQSNRLDGGKGIGEQSCGTKFQETAILAV